MIRIGYLTITPETTGSPITGPSVYSQAPDTIEVLDVTHMVRHEYDAQHGTPSGDRKHEPLRIIKSIDCTTPLLYAMCCNAELLTEVKLDYFVQIGSAPDPVPFFSWTLTNAYITHIKSITAKEMPEEFSEQYDLLEEIAFSYQEITWTHHAHRAPIGLKELPQEIQQDSWSSIA
ncbi:type VI secretion system tube protein Hcp [Candidatus Poribacteria bacterium]|nr:type VI secretion system tube protein Hcp [Candidatus Poribacteria bacterium]